MRETKVAMASGWKAHVTVRSLLFCLTHQQVQKGRDLAANRSVRVPILLCLNCLMALHFDCLDPVTRCTMDDVRCTGLWDLSGMRFLNFVREPAGYMRRAMKTARIRKKVGDDLGKLS